MRFGSCSLAVKHGWCSARDRVDPYRYVAGPRGSTSLMAIRVRDRHVRDLPFLFLFSELTRLSTPPPLPPLLHCPSLSFYLFFMLSFLLCLFLSFSLSSSPSVSLYVLSPSLSTFYLCVSAPPPLSPSLSRNLIPFPCLPGKSAHDPESP